MSSQFLILRGWGGGRLRLACTEIKINTQSVVSHILLSVLNLKIRDNHNQRLRCMDWPSIQFVDNNIPISIGLTF